MSVVEDLENENLGLLKTVDDLKAEIERLRGVLAAIPNMPWSMVNSHVRQALEGETK